MCVCVSVCTLSVRGLLQITVDFEAVVPRVSHHHMAIGGEGQALGTVERVCRCVDVGEERTTAIKHLYSAIAPVCHDDVPVDVHCHPRRGVELAVPLPVGTKLQKKLPLRVEHLQKGTQSLFT